MDRQKDIQMDEKLDSMQMDEKIDSMQMDGKKDTYVGNERQIDRQIFIL